MKIAIIAHGLSDGGAERVASILANNLVNNNYTILFICAYNSKFEYRIDEKIRIRTIQATSDSRLVRFIQRNKLIYDAIKDFGADCIISFINHVLLFTVLKGIPVIYSLRNHPESIRGRGIKAIIFDYEYRYAKKVVFQTEGARDLFSAKIQKKSIVIANPIDTNELPYWSEFKHKKVFITACRLNKQKNLPMLFKAFSLVHKIYPEFTLEIYGDGELRDELEEMIVAMKASNYIFLKGWTANIHTIMAESFAFVMSSDYEGLSNSMLEALCIGTPCICTDCPPGGAKSYIQNGVNGFLTPVGDSEKMAQRMLELIENPQLGTQFSYNSIKFRNILASDNICNMWIESVIK